MTSTTCTLGMVGDEAVVHRSAWRRRWPRTAHPAPGAGARRRRRCPARRPGTRGTTRSRSVAYSAAVSAGPPGWSVRCMHGVRSLPANDTTSTPGRAPAKAVNVSSRSHTAEPPKATTSVRTPRSPAIASIAGAACSAKESPTTATSSGGASGLRAARATAKATMATPARPTTSQVSRRAGRADPGTQAGNPRRAQWSGRRGRAGRAGGAAGAPRRLDEGEPGLVERAAQRRLRLAEARPRPSTTAARASMASRASSVRGVGWDRYRPASSKNWRACWPTTTPAGSSRSWRRTPRPGWRTPRRRPAPRATGRPRRGPVRRGPAGPRTGRRTSAGRRGVPRMGSRGSSVLTLERGAGSWTRTRRRVVDSSPTAGTLRRTTQWEVGPAHSVISAEGHVAPTRPPPAERASGSIDRTGHCPSRTSASPGVRSSFSADDPVELVSSTGSCVRRCLRIDEE